MSANSYVRPTLDALRRDIERQADQATLRQARRTLRLTRPRRWWLAITGKTPLEYVVDPDFWPIRLKIRGKWE